MRGTKPPPRFDLSQYVNIATPLAQDPQSSQVNLGSSIPQVPQVTPQDTWYQTRFGNDVYYHIPSSHAPILVMGATPSPNNPQGPISSNPQGPTSPQGPTNPQGPHPIIPQGSNLHGPTLTLFVPPHPPSQPSQPSGYTGGGTFNPFTIVPTHIPLVCMHPLNLPPPPFNPI